MSDTPTPPPGWRLVDKAKDRRKDHPIIISFGEAEGWLSVAKNSYDCWNSSIEYAVPIKEPPKPPTINNIPWITDRVPTAGDACDNGMVLMWLQELDQGITQHWERYPTGTPWIPLNKSPPPKSKCERKIVVQQMRQYLRDGDVGHECRVSSATLKSWLRRLEQAKVREVMEDES